MDPRAPHPFFKDTERAGVFSLYELDEHGTLGETRLHATRGVESDLLVGHLSRVLREEPVCRVQLVDDGLIDLVCGGNRISTLRIRERDEAQQEQCGCGCCDYANRSESLSLA